MIYVVTLGFNLLRLCLQNAPDGHFMDPGDMDENQSISPGMDAAYDPADSFK